MQIWKRIATKAMRDALVTAVILFSVTTATCYVVYQSAAEGLKKEVQTYLMSLAATASEMVDTEGHKLLTKPEQKGTPLYENVRAPFMKILKANTNIAFIYTIVQRDEKYFFILDSQIPKPGEKDDTSGLMEEYTEYTDIMKHALETHLPAVEEEAYTDKWGTFLSGYAPIFDKDSNFIGIVGVDIRIDDYLEHLSRIRQSLYLGMIIAFVAACLIGFGVWVVRNKAEKAELASREQQAHIRQMEERRRQEQEEAEERMQQEVMRQRAAIAEEFNSSVKTVVEVISKASLGLEASAKRISLMAFDSSQKTKMAEEAVNASAENMERISGETHNLLDGIEQIILEADKSVNIAQTATKEAHAAGSKSSELTKAAENIHEVATLINSIAEQINLLALNATIEAARAGESGKGFAVVALEVKRLSTQANEATTQIREYLDSIRFVAKQTGTAIESISKVIQDLNESSSRVLSVTMGQKESISNISHEIREAATVSHSANIDIRTISTLAENSGNSTKEILDAVVSLTGQTERLNHEVDNFLTVLMKES